jgi:hypothetical protein
MTQEEAGRLTDIRSASAPAVVRPGPARGTDRAMLALDRRSERELIMCLLVHPPLLREVPAEILDASHAEGRALAALVEMGALEELSHGVILETFRGSEHEPVLKRIAGELLDKHLDIEVAQAVFRDAITAIRTRSPNPRIRELEQKDAREGLSKPEYEEYRRLIADDAALKRSRTPPSAVL